MSGTLVGSASVPNLRRVASTPVRECNEEGEEEEEEDEWDKDERWDERDEEEEEGVLDINKSQKELNTLLLTEKFELDNDLF